MWVTPKWKIWRSKPASPFCELRCSSKSDFVFVRWSQRSISGLQRHESMPELWQDFPEVVLRLSWIWYITDSKAKSSAFILAHARNTATQMSDNRWIVLDDVYSLERCMYIPRSATTLRLGARGYPRFCCQNQATRLHNIYIHIVLIYILLGASLLYFVTL